MRICEFVVDLISYKGEPALLGIVRDLTDQKRTEDALQTTNKKPNLLSRMTRHDITNKVAIQPGMPAREVRAPTGLTITETGEPGKKGARFEIRVPEGGFRFTKSEREIPAATKTLIAPEHTSLP